MRRPPACAVASVLASSCAFRDITVLNVDVTRKSCCLAVSVCLSIGRFAFNTMVLNTVATLAVLSAVGRYKYPIRFVKSVRLIMHFVASASPV